MRRTIAGLCMIATLIAWPQDSRAADEEKCLAPAGWFPATPPATNEKPDPDQDCDFYKWAWQTFLYTTQAEPGGDPRPRFLAYMAPEDLFSAASTPRFPKTDRATLGLAPRLAKQPDPVGLKDFLQATSQGVVIDRAGRVVYYGIHLNPTFVNFVKANKFDADVENIKNAPADLEFPKGSLEMKSSWKVLGPSDDRSKFFTQNAAVSVITLKNGRPTIDISVPPRPETMGLVGLHVVGVVDGHPEFIWATFEHVNNAPGLKPGADPNGTEAVDDTRDYTFYPRSTAADLCNRKKIVTFLSQADQTFQPASPISRVFPFGGESKEDPAITSLNASVNDSIDKLAPGLAVWKNYKLTGAVWLNNTAYFRENADFAAEDNNKPELKILGGERKLSNSTMETFTQLARVNCFTCHTTMAESVGPLTIPPKRISVSHILTNAYLNAKQAGQ